MILRPLHEQQSRKSFEEETVDPGRHGVRVGVARMNIQHKDRPDDGADDQHHGEEQVLADERRR